MLCSFFIVKCEACMSLRICWSASLQPPNIWLALENHKEWYRANKPCLPCFIQNYTYCMIRYLSGQHTLPLPTLMYKSGQAWSGVSRLSTSRVILCRQSDEPPQAPCTLHFITVSLLCCRSHLVNFIYISTHL